MPGLVGIGRSVGARALGTIERTRRDALLIATSGVNAWGRYSRYERRRPLPSGAVAQ
jgi:hypothetical protein